MTLGGAAFRRPLRLLPPIAVALALVAILSVAGAFDQAATFATQTSNSFAQPPTKWHSVLQYIVGEQ